MKDFKYRISTSIKKNAKTSYQVREILIVFWKLVVLRLDENHAKGLKITKIVKQAKFKKAWGALEAKKMFPETIMDKIFETNSCFHVK